MHEAQHEVNDDCSSKNEPSPPKEPRTLLPPRLPLVLLLEVHELLLGQEAGFFEVAFSEITPVASVVAAMSLDEYI